MKTNPAHFRGWDKPLKEIEDVTVVAITSEIS